VIDAWSRKVVGWPMRADLRAEPAASPGRSSPSLRSRLSIREFAIGKTMQEAGILPSMGRRGDAFDNAVAESFFATLGDRAACGSGSSSSVAFSLD
jgi:putative transposase